MTPILLKECSEVFQERFRIFFCLRFRALVPTQFPATSVHDEHIQQPERPRHGIEQPNHQFDLTGLRANYQSASSVGRLFSSSDVRIIELPIFGVWSSKLVVAFHGASIAVAGYRHVRSEERRVGKEWRSRWA